jgi:hypothetical protein
MMTVRVYKLLDGEELIAEEMLRTPDGYILQKPLRLDYIDVGKSSALRLTRYLTLDSGLNCELLKNHVIAISSCSSRAVDYYSKMVDKCYTEIFPDPDHTRGEPMSGITPEEILSLITGKTSIQ